MDALKVLNYDIVKSFVQSKYGVGVEFTSREVKNYLRQEGYWATQADISYCIQEMVKEGLVTYRQEPDFALYGSPTVFNRYSLVNNTSSGNFTITTPTVTYDEVEETGQPSIGDWRLFSYSDSTIPEIYVKGNVPRNVARAYYEVAQDVRYTDIGCSMVR